MGRSDKATVSTDDHKKLEKHLKKVEEQCKPRGSKLVAATPYKVLTEGDMEYQSMPKSAGESLMCVVGQRKLRAWLSGTLFSLWSKESECLSKVLTGRSGLTHS